MGITLLANAAGDDETASGRWSADDRGGGWIHDFLAALPGGPGEVDAWSAHPYGSMTKIGNGDVGWPALADWHNLAVKYGSNAPWYITEVGQCTGGSACGTPVSEAEQAADLTQYLNGLVQADPKVPGTPFTFVKYFDWYEAANDANGQFGLFDVSTQPFMVTRERPIYRALASWMASHTSQTDG